MKRSTIKLLLVACAVLCLPTLGQCQIFVPIGSTGTATIDASGISAARPASFKIILNANATVSIINGVGGQTVYVLFVENAAGGFSVSLASNINGICPVSTFANAYTSCAFTYDAGNNAWVAASTGNSGSGSAPAVIKSTIAANCSATAGMDSIVVGCPGGPQFSINGGPLSGFPGLSFANTFTGANTFTASNIFNAPTSAAGIQVTQAATGGNPGLRVISGGQASASAFIVADSTNAPRFFTNGNTEGTLNVTNNPAVGSIALTPPTLTAARTQTYQDVSGTFTYRVGTPDDRTAQSASFGPITLFSTGAGGSGMYLVTYTLSITTADASGASVAATVNWTSDGVARSRVGNSTAFASTANDERIATSIFVDASTNITYQVTVTGVPTTGQFASHVRVVKIL